MSETSEERLYGLIEIAERQQQVAQTAIEGMVKERVALEMELRRLSEGTTQLQDDIREMVLNAVLETRSGAEQAGAAVAEGATDSLRTVLDDVSNQARLAQATLQDVTQWISWRFLGFGLAGTIALAVLWWLASCAVLWWDTSAIGEAQVRKAQLEAEVAELQANKKTWEEAGLLNQLSRCGPKKRPCVKVEDRAGTYGEHGDYRIIGSN